MSRTVKCRGTSTARASARLYATVRITMLGFAIVAATNVAAAQSAPVVRTAKGPLRGVAAEGVARFLGIPYAAPPVGRLRWMPPVESRAWRAIRPADAFGPACAQSTTLGVFAGPKNNNEDCLYLNVFAPSRGLSRASKLPVLVWLHGGGWVNGASSDYDGTWLAQAGAIVVTVNYRLNLMGVLAHPALDREGHRFANYGLLDQQAALRWVRDNIAWFGGDPARVTLAGQSAGGTSVGLHLISPLAAGLFHRGIIQSGQTYWNPTPLAEAQARGIAFAQAAGCGELATAATAACLRRLPASTIERLAGPEPGRQMFTTVSVIDGTILPTDGVTAFKTGRFNHVPLMNGSTQDEGNFFLAVQQYESGKTDKAITDGDVTSFVKGAYSPDTGERLLQTYAPDAYSTPQLRLSAMRTDPFVCRIQRGNHAWVGQVPVWAFEFRDRTAPAYFPEAPGFRSLADHTLDLPYLFRGFHGGNLGLRRGLTEQQRRLSHSMVQAWVNFARTGNPNGSGNAPWPAYVNDPAAPSYVAQTLDGFTTFSDATFTASHKCDFWNALGN